MKTKIDYCYLIFEKLEKNLSINKSFELGLSLGLLISNLTVYENMGCEEAKEILKNNILESKEGELFTLLYSNEINEEQLIIQAQKMLSKK